MSDNNYPGTFCTPAFLFPDTVSRSIYNKVPMPYTCFAHSHIQHILSHHKFPARVLSGDNYHTKFPDFPDDHSFYSRLYGANTTVLTFLSHNSHNAFSAGTDGRHCYMDLTLVRLLDRYLAYISDSNRAPPYRDTFPVLFVERRD